MSAGLDTSTVTPGSTAPLESRTTPAISAFCAETGAGTSVSASNKPTETHVSRVTMLSPLPIRDVLAFKSFGRCRISAELYYCVHVASNSCHIP